MRGEALSKRQLFEDAVITADLFCYWFLPSISFEAIFPPLSRSSFDLQEVTRTRWRFLQNVSARYGMSSQVTPSD